MDPLNSESAEVKACEKLPDTLKYYTDVKEELEKYNEEMREMYSNLLMKTVEVTRLKSQFTSVKGNMQIAQEMMRKYTLENNKKD